MFELSNYGNAFKFNWTSTNDSHLAGKNKDTFGIVKAEETSLLGFFELDSRVLCDTSCYLGLSPRTHNSIIDQSALSINDLDNLESYEQSLLYDLWTRSFQLRQLEMLSSENSDAFDIDSKLLMLYYKRWHELNERDDLFKSILRLEMLNENKETKSTDKLNFSFPIEFNFEWPRLLKNMPKIHFSSTQVHVGARVKNLTIENPSNARVLMQIMILDAYPQGESLIRLLKNISNFHGLKKSPIQYDNLIDEDLNTLNESPFTISSNSNLTISSSNKNVVVLSLEPHQAAEIQIQFKPEKLEIYHSLLLIRNNLTIMDTYLIKAKGGSAHVRIENMTPMKSSLFLNEINNREVSQKTSDYSPLEFHMTENDFKLCGDSSYFSGFSLRKFFFNPFRSKEEEEEEQLTKKKNFLGTTKKGAIIELPPHFLNATIEPNHFDLVYEDYVTAYEINEGIMLRELFELNNIGDAKLIVYGILFDGESCSSSGFSAGYCKQFTVHYSKQNKVLLDIRYQPDFTMSFIRKTLTLVTNIG
jgi:hypothetical protein